MVHLVRLAHLALAEALDLLGEPGALVLRASLDLPAATALRALAEHPDHLVRQVDQALEVDPARLGSAHPVALAGRAA